MQTYSTQSIELSTLFSKTLISEISACSEDDIDDMWLTHQSRNKFFRFLMPKLEGKLGFRCRKEYLLNGRRFDFVFSGPAIGQPFPKILIEVENNPKIAHDEVKKLAQYADPLKILFTVTEWDETLWVNTLNPSRREKFLLKWNSLVRDSRADRQQDSVFLLMVGERTPQDTLRIYSEMLEDGPIKPVKETLLTERSIEGFSKHVRGWKDGW